MSEADLPEPSCKRQEQFRGDLEQAVRAQSELPVANPTPLEKFIYWLTPNALRRWIKRTNQEVEIQYLRRSRAFDPAWYLRQHPDVARAQMDPAAHYIKHGEGEGRSPSPLFLVDAHRVRAFRRKNFRQCYWVAYLKRWRLEPRMRLCAGVSETPRSSSSPSATPFASFAVQKVPGTTHVLFIGHEASKTGAPIALKHLMLSLEKTNRIQPWFVADGDGPLFDDYAALTPAIRSTDYPISRSSFIHSLARWFAQMEGPKVAVCNTVVTREYAKALHDAGIPVIAWVHELPTSITRFGGGAQTMKTIFQSARQVVYVSRSVQQANNRAFGSAPDFGRVIHNGVTPETSRDGQFREKLARELRIPISAPLVMGCGSIDGRKGVDLFIRVAHNILTEMKGEGTQLPHFIWVGAGTGNEWHTWCIHDAKILGIARQVHFSGERNDIADFYQHSRVFLLTSREDPFPLVSMEAMAYGLPVIAFAGATGQGILLKRCGVVVPYLETDAMAQAAITLLRAPQQCAEVGQAVSRHILEHYSWDRCAADFMGEIDAILAVKRPD